MKFNPVSQTQAQATDSPKMSTLAKIRQKEQEVEISILEAKKNAENLISSARATAENIIHSAFELPNDAIESALNNAKKTVVTIQANAKENLKKEVDFFDAKISHNIIDKATDYVISSLLKKITP